MGGQSSEKGVTSGVVKGIVKIKLLVAAFTITAIFYSHNIMSVALRFDYGH